MPRERSLYPQSYDHHESKEAGLRSAEIQHDMHEGKEGQDSSPES